MRRQKTAMRDFLAGAEERGNQGTIRQSDQREFDRMQREFDRLEDEADALGERYDELVESEQRERARPTHAEGSPAAVTVRSCRGRV